MMLYRNVLNFLRGSVQVEIECACPERVLNLCAVEEIAFWICSGSRRLRCACA